MRGVCLGVAEVAKGLPESSIVYQPVADSQEIDFLTTDGPNALLEAINDNGDSGHFIVSTIPSGAHRSKVKLQIDPP